MELPPDFAASTFWNDSANAAKAYTEAPPSDELIARVEAAPVMLDYRACGPQGEPAVGHVDQENDYRITPLAPDFKTFVRGLLPTSAFEE